MDRTANNSETHSGERNTESPTLLTQFMDRLMQPGDTLDLVRKALSLIAPVYDILSVEGTLKNSPHKDAEEIIFQNTWTVDTISDEAAPSFSKAAEAPVCMTRVLNANSSVAVIKAYHGNASAKWTDSQRQELKNLLSILLLALENEHLTKTMKRNALIDPLTNLLNTTGFLAHAAKLRASGRLSLYNAFYFNLKSFGLVNRRFGKSETDQIIVRYAKALSAFAEDEECVGRLGGDNFIALIRKEKSDAFLRFIGGVETVGMIDGEEIPIVIQAVAGGLELDEGTPANEDIIGKCGMALQLARNVERVPYIFVTPELNSRVYQQKQIVEQFPSALAGGEFKVFYQPKVDTSTNEIVGAEALIRWFSGGRIIPPGEFVPIIEKDGSICQLDFYVLESVCRDISDWLKNGIRPVRISTNFSRKNLAHPDFADHILRILKQYDIPREYLEVEITETADAAENELLINFMNCMHSEKIATAIDDFGTGYTSLNVLSDFAVDVLKIDKSFIEKHTKTEKDSVVLSNVVKMAKELDMTIINEGVENWEQVDFLQNLGSPVVQGFLFDKPLPEESFRQRLRLGKYDLRDDREDSSDL